MTNSEEPKVKAKRINKGGKQNKYIPNDEHRAIVVALARIGATLSLMKDALDLDEETIRRHYKKEITETAVKSLAKAANTLFQRATNGGSDTCLIFWLKTRGMGLFRETTHLEIDTSRFVVSNEPLDEAQFEEIYVKQLDSKQDTNMGTTGETEDTA